MSLDVLGYVIGGAFSFGAVVYTVWATRKAKEATDVVEKVRADGEAYGRAMEINKSIVSELQQEVSRLIGALADVRMDLLTEKTRTADLEVKTEKLQRSVNLLRALLIEHDIPIPAEAS